MPIWLPEDLVARGARLHQDALGPVAANDVVLLRVGAADGVLLE